MCTLVRIRLSVPLIAGTAFALEAALFSTLSALLPHYEQTLGISTFAAGVLSGSYTAGMIVGTLVAGVWASGRFGVRPTALAGCLLLALASVGFGAATSIASLDFARGVQGIGAGLVWCSLLNWLVLVVPPGRRGAAIGVAIGAGVFGTAAGPLLGVATQVVGSFAIFAAVAFAVLCLAAVLARFPAPQANPGEAVGGWAMLRLPPDRRLRWTCAIVLVPPTVAAAVITLAPLQLDDVGASETMVAVALLLGSLVSTVTCPMAGRAADRIGYRRPVLFGVVVTIFTCVGLALSHATIPITVSLVLFEGLGLAFFWIPMMTLLTERAEAAGMSAAGAVTVLNLTLTVGYTVGPPALTALDQATDTTTAYLAISALCLLLLSVTARWRGFGAGRAAALVGGEAPG
ncbi:MAG: MFS transporter [Solirubrobacterales bacterium]